MRTAQLVSSPTGGHCLNGGTVLGWAEAGRAFTSKPATAMAMTNIMLVANTVSLLWLTFVVFIFLPALPLGPSRDTVGPVLTCPRRSATELLVCKPERPMDMS